MNEVIVCAAVRSSKTQQVVCGVKHGDETMFTVDDLDIYVEMFDEQGFMTNKLRFVDRQEAWVIANRENQIIKLVGGNNVDGGTLFSENLY